MRTALLTTIFFLLQLALPAYAQLPPYKLKHTLGSQLDFHLFDMSIDKAGNVYVVDSTNVLKIKDGEIISKIPFSRENYGGTGSRPADIAVDDAFNIYLANVYKSQISKYDQAGNLVQVIDITDNSTSNKIHPFQILIDSQSNIYAFDSDQRRLYGYDQSGALLKTIDILDLEPTDSTTAIIVAFDQHDNLYIAENKRVFQDQNSDTIVPVLFILNKSGALVKRFSDTILKEAGNVVEPADIQLDKNGNIYISDASATVKIFSPDGKFLRRVSSSSPNAIEDKRNYKIGFDTENKLYLGCFLTLGSTIEIFNSDFETTDWWGAKKRPQEVVFDRHDNLYILDFFTNKVIKVDTTGNELLEFGGISAGITAPLAMAVDDHDFIYILDARRKDASILKFDPSGALVATFDGIKSEANISTVHLNRAGLAVDHAGNMYVANYFNFRTSVPLAKYDSEGNYITSFGSIGKEKGQIWYPQDVTVDGLGFVYINDLNGRRIQKFSSDGQFIQQTGSFNPNEVLWSMRSRISSDTFGNIVLSYGNNTYGYGAKHYTSIVDIKGNTIQTLPDGTPSVAISRSGRYIAAADQNKDIVSVYENNLPRAYNIIQGSVYHETNSDCTPNAHEKGLAAIIVKIEPGPYYGSTDKNGDFSILVEKGTYKAEPVLENVAGKKVNYVCHAGPDKDGITFSGYGNVSTNNKIGIGLTLSPLLSVSVSSTRRRRCFESTTTVRYENAGFASAPDAKVYVQLPAEVGLLSADKAYTRMPDGTYEFAVGDLAAGQQGTITIKDIVTCGDESVRGRTVCTRSWMTPSNNKPTQPTPTITITGRCDGESGMIRFVIRNSGTADMEQHELFRKFANGALSSVEQFRLAAGDSMVLRVPSMGYTWRLEADQPDGNGDNKKVSVTVEACTDANAGTTVSSGLVNLMPTDDEEAEASEECMMITDSYDPNDKLVTPEGRTSEHYTPTGTALKYKIRFQNTGTDVAYRVVVVDTLSEHLDLSTLQVGAASHAHRFEVSGKGQPVLTWTFDNILLPDSTADEPGSHGYIQFSIKPKADLPEKTAVENLADIFFDFNSPVRTNVTVNRIYDMPPVVDEAVRVNLEDVLATPAVAAFEPAAGQFGEEITLTGKRFAPDAADNKVYLNGKAATVVSATDSELRVLVPAGATTGALKVVTPDGGATASETFTVYQPPVLSSFSPVEGMVGQTVTLQGQHLQPELIESIKLGNSDCGIINHSGNSVTVQVPAGATTGTFKISTKGGAAVSTSPYVVWHSPAISSLSKEADIIGAFITITGENFAADKARNSVLFGQAEALVLEATPQQLVVRVPEQAESGLITVETPGGQAATPFEVIPGPWFAAMQPARGSVGTVVEISGRHFGVMGLQDKVAFNGQEALVLEASGDRYKVRVPRGATTGKVQITGFGGNAYSTADFVVEELAPEKAIRVYPNPNSGRFTLSLQHADFDVQSVEIFDGTGRLVHTTAVDGPRPEELDLQIRPAKPGLYTLRITSGRGLIIKKVTVL